MATEVEIDPSFQLKRDPHPTANDARKSPLRKSLMGVFKKKSNTLYASIEDTPPTAPSTPDGNEDANAISKPGDSAFGFDADDNNNLMAMDVPDIFPHGHHDKGTMHEPNQTIQPAQFKVPTKFEPEQETVLDDSPGKPEEEGGEQTQKLVESTHPHIGLVPAHTNPLTKNDSVFCSLLKGFYEEQKTNEPTMNGLRGAKTSEDPAIRATSQREIIDIGSVEEEYSRHENFEVVLDQTFYSTPNDFLETVDDPVLDIQRDLEGFERQMKQESKEEKLQRAQVDTAPNEPAVTSNTPLQNSPFPLDEVNQESPIGTVEVSVEEPPEVKISVETKPAVRETKTKKEKKSRKINLEKLTKKVKAMSSRASMKAISSKASKVLKSVPMSVSLSSKEKTEAVPPSEPERPVQPTVVWRAVEDPKSGKVYYYHRTTRETTWTKPQEYVEYERAMVKYERDRIAYEKYHHKPIEEVLIDTSVKAEHPMSMEGDGLSDEAEEKKDDDEGVNLGSYHDEDLEEAPFDERSAEPKPFDEAYEDPKPLLSMASQGRVASQFSTMTEKTQRINNVSNENQISNKPQGSFVLDILDEGNQEQQSQPSGGSPIRGQRDPQYGLSSPHRTRELLVEDLGSSRVTAETFDRRGRVVKGREFSSNGDHTGFSEGRPAAESNSFDHDDSISALSEAELDYNMRRENFNAARHRALVDAIDRKDGDLLKALMAGMKASGDGMLQSYPTWNQIEIDRMIAQSDWDGVRSYVSEVSGVHAPKPVSKAISHEEANVAPKRAFNTDEMASMQSDYSA